ncbi:hypothetical protein DE146DRAFT_277879 [Phaeosphaeria sp. MPI-PUGE-AT-0046c]|nr:hypothetical protein DE146DRAFT_277879 [Phaeosphaeria sp. MPI-PUGE-AT-0046c]
MWTPPTTYRVPSSLLIEITAAAPRCPILVDMAEVVGIISAAQATCQFLEQAFQIIGRLRRAHQRQKALVTVLNSHENELQSVESVIVIIETEVELHKKSVAHELVRLKDVHRKLTVCLEDLDPKPKGKASQFTRQLVHGSAEEKRLAEIMKELIHIKTMLLLRIQFADVGVIRGMEQQLYANTEVIQRIDTSLREHLEDCKGLRIAKLLKGRRPSNDGTVPLTPDDLERLGRQNDDSDTDETLVDEDEFLQRGGMGFTKRVVRDNETQHLALQINGPIERDMYKDVNCIVIKGNKASNHSIQTNYPVSLEVAMRLFDIKEKLSAAHQT